MVRQSQPSGQSSGSPAGRPGPSSGSPTGRPGLSSGSEARRPDLSAGSPARRTREHTYTTTVTWTGNLGTGTSGYRAYERTTDIVAAGRPVLAASSDPLFRGDPARWNPELLLVAALSQCHLLWYLHLCSDAGVVVESYVDDAVGTMAEEVGGPGRFTAVVLRPRVVVATPAMVAVARDLHVRANELCYIAQSVNFPVHHDPTVVAVDVA